MKDIALRMFISSTGNITLKLQESGSRAAALQTARAPAKWIACKTLISKGNAKIKFDNSYLVDGIIFQAEDFTNICFEVGGIAPTMKSPQLDRFRDEVARIQFKGKRMKSTSLILCTAQALSFALAAVAMAADQPYPENRRLSAAEFRDGRDHSSSRTPEKTIALTRLIAMAADPAAGIWKLDRTKTKAKGATASAINVDLIQIEVLTDTIVLNWQSRGRTLHGGFTAKYDGQDYPVKGDPHADTVSLRRIDAGTIDFIYKKNGEIAMTERSLVSKDGRTSVLRTTYKDEKGRDVTGVTVWEKQ